MSNKWRTTIRDADWVYVRYSVNPGDLSTETLIRKITGVDKSVLATLIATLRAASTVDAPYADGQSYSGTWSVKSVEPTPDEQGNTQGSVDIVQELRRFRSDYATADTARLMRSRAYPYEQNENAWMYYERACNEETTRFKGLTSVTGEVYDGLRQIRTLTDFNTAVTAAADTYTWTDAFDVVHTEYYHRKFLYNVIYVDSAAAVLVGDGSLTEGHYYIGGTPEYTAKHGVTSWYFTWTEVENPVISECWYEDNEDTTYDVYRTIVETSNTAIVRTRARQYAGMVLVDGAAIEDSTEIKLKGFLNETERIHEHAKFRIGNDVYRVTADVDCVAGKATVSITPPVTECTETLTDDYSGQVQVYFEAL